MRKFFLAALVISFLSPYSALAAPKPIAIKDATVIATDVQSDGLIASGGNLITFTSTTSTTLDITLAARSASGVAAWSKVIDSGQNEIAMVATSDNNGSIWLAGVSASSPQPDTSTPQVAGVNPDGVTLETLPKLRKEMDQITLWNLSPNGDLLATYLYPLKEASLITAIALDSKGISIAGARKSGAFVVSASLTGIFGKVTAIGSTKTSISAIARHADGSVSAFGSSSETLASKKLVGVVDGVLIKISKSGAITSVVRSTAPKARRNWSTATPSLFLTGEVSSSKGYEIAITKFTPQFAPTWTTRYLGSGKGVGINLPNNSFAVALTPSALPKGLSGQKFNQDQAVILIFDSKGVLTSAYTNGGMGAPAAITYSLDGGINVLAKGVSAESLSIFHLNSR
jgi:hypothetical protein